VHTDHLNACRGLNQQGITAFFKEKLLAVAKLNQRIVSLTEAINLLMEKENLFSSQDFIRLALDAMNFSDISRHLNVLE
jgi:hypothetical protein